MKKLTAAQTKSITNAKDQVKAAANVMIETPLELIKCILLKHETAVIEVMKELHDEKMRLQQQREELLAALLHIQQVACSESPELGIATEALARVIP